LISSRLISIVHGAVNLEAKKRKLVLSETEVLEKMDLVKLNELEKQGAPKGIFWEADDRKNYPDNTVLENLGRSHDSGSMVSICRADLSELAFERMGTIPIDCGAR
jgi:hypothetical protein